MTGLAIDTVYMTARHARHLLRQPAWIIINLVQPIVWLLLFGALFQRVTDIPGFTAGDYIEFLAPGVVVMTAFFTGAWSGMPVLEDLGAGILDRFLVTGVRRGALITGRLVQGALQIAIQTLIVVGLALATGARFEDGFVGVAVVMVVAILLGAAFGALSIALALVTRRQETMIALMQFVMLPLTFLSVAFMQKSLMPGWMQTLSAFNPVSWAAEAGRDALSASVDWDAIALRSGLLAVFVAASLLLAVRALRSYQLSL